MTLHHAVTVYLFGFSYMGNFVIGGPVTFLHNWADVCISWTRMWGETRFYNSVALYSFVFSQCIWIYTRLYVFGQLIVASMTLEVYTHSPYVQPIFGFLLVSLYILHIYWVILMLRIIYKSLIDKKLEDTINKHKVKHE